ncbi:globin-1-like [Branchiostoma floridae]|uniref:Globin-1-like n=1 Tax=Branchiostoma floridae TaxID=7739 RepID=A0A9J7K946_BRAFL|nr:globin-1-like [Branchiostoma floridae]
MGSGASRPTPRKRKAKKGPLPSPQPPKPLDPRLKLDAKEKFFLEKSWKTVARNEDVAAMAMFINLFRSSPEIKDKWPQLRKLSEDEMRDSPYLQKLSVRILGAMDHVIGPYGKQTITTPPSDIHVHFS